MDRVSSSLSNACSNSSGNPDAHPGHGGDACDILRQCELCKEHVARVYCASDEAQLCWACDERIHSANFLVARHPRTLLCPLCGAFLQLREPGHGQLVCYTCCGGWLDSDEESKVEDKDHSGTDEQDYDDDEDQQNSREISGGSSGCSRKLSAPQQWSATSGAHESYGMQWRWGTKQEGMGDSQEEDYDYV